LIHLQLPRMRLVWLESHLSLVEVFDLEPLNFLMTVVPTFFQECLSPLFELFRNKLFDRTGPLSHKHFLISLLPPSVADDWSRRLDRWQL